MNENLVREDEYENYLLVEGDEDKYVFDQLLGLHKLPEQFKVKHENFDIKSKGGISNLLDTLKMELKANERRRLGIVVDADTDLDARWQALRGKLTDFGYSENKIPRKPNPVGTIITQDGYPIVGIWLMPNNKVSGVIEDFVSLLVPHYDLLWPLAGDVIQRVIERDRRFRETYQSKACLHTWLAWQEDPGTPLRLAITKHYLDAYSPRAQELVSWMRKLFDLDLV